MKDQNSPTLNYETRLYQNGTWPAAGIDEAGRGAWAGPVVAAAVVLPPPSDELRLKLEGVRDSKLMTPAHRDKWFDTIMETAVDVGVGNVPARQIDEIGIVPATHQAMLESLQQLHTEPAHLLIDHLQLPTPIPQTPITRGDRFVLSIAAASIIAKVTRDRLMLELDAEFPGYSFASSKGYGTKDHRSGLQKLGACAQHRHSYQPVAQLKLPGIQDQI